MSCTRSFLDEIELDSLFHSFQILTFDPDSSDLFASTRELISNELSSLTLDLVGLHELWWSSDILATASRTRVSVEDEYWRCTLEMIHRRLICWILPQSVASERNSLHSSRIRHNDSNRTTLWLRAYSTRERTSLARYSHTTAKWATLRLCASPWVVPALALRNGVLAVSCGNRTLSAIRSLVLWFGVFAMRFKTSALAFSLDSQSER